MTNDNDYPDFDEAAARADIQAYDPERAIGNAPRSRAMSSNDNRAATFFQLSALSPEDRTEVTKRLQGITDPDRRAAAEAREVEAVIRNYAVSANISRGHPNGNAFDREVASISFDVQTLEREGDRIRADLADIARHETGPNGKPIPVYRYSGARREGLEDRLRQIARNILELEGVGGQHRLDRAMSQELATRRQAHEDLRIMRLAEKRAAEIVMDERIEELARAKAKGLRNNL